MEENNQYVIDESDEISVGFVDGVTDKFLAAFPAFQHKNYRYYFAGQLISFVGTWMQIIALAWLVYTMTNSPFWLGAMTALGTLPVFLFSLFAGVLTDRFPKKQLLLCTNGMLFLLTLLLAILTLTSHISLSILGVLVFLIGTFDAFEKPTRHAFVPAIVEKENLSSAIAINSGMYNAARIIGPSIAGFILVVASPGGAFLVNAISYAVAMYFILNIKLTETKKTISQNPFIALKLGLMYAYSHISLRLILLFVGMSSIFGWSYTTIIPVIGKTVFHQGPAGFTSLYSASGVGAVCATIFLSSYGRKMNPLLFILGGNALFVVAIIFFSLTHSFLLALLFLFFAGFGLIGQFATMNSTIQHLVSDSMRGRVMSLYIFMFIGLSPLGSFQIGYISEKFGPAFALQMCCFFLTLYSVVFFFKRKQLALSPKKE